MPTYRYKVRDKYGRASTGVIEGESKKAVAKHLVGIGYSPVSIEEAKSASNLSGVLKKGFRRVSFEDLSAFTRGLMTLQRAGVPILSSLEGLGQQTENRRFKKIISEIMRDVEAGKGLSDAMAKHPKVFDEYYVNAIRAGETAGVLDQVLTRLVVVSERECDTRLKVKTATLYPIIVLACIILVFLIVFAFVLPRFALLFVRFKAALPLPTRILLATSHVVRNYWAHILGVTVIIGFTLHRFIKTKPGRAMWDNLRLKMPIFGPLIFKLTMSRFARLAGTLIQSGLPILQSLEILSRAVGNVIFARAIENIRVSVIEGKGMAEPMKVSRLFPPIVVQMVAVGEETGKVYEMLLEVSNHYDSEIDYAVRRLTVMLELFLVLVLACMVLLMALAIFLPWWSLPGLYRR